MKLSDYAKELGVCYKTAWRMWKNNKIPHPTEQLETGTIIVHVRKNPDELGQKKVAIYARVSSAENKDNLERQAERLEQYATAKGYQIVRIVEEVGSGINDKRRKLEELLQEEGYNILLVEHPDRLARFGTNYLSVLLARSGVKLEIVNLAKDEKRELVDDLISIITSFSAKLYGQRRSRRKTEKIIKELEDATD